MRVFSHFISDQRGRGEAEAATEEEGTDRRDQNTDVEKVGGRLLHLDAFLRCLGVVHIKELLIQALDRLVRVTGPPAATVVGRRIHLELRNSKRR